MIIHTSVDLSELFRLGKKYSWTRPTHCPKCFGIRLWSHGYASRYFDGYIDALFVKRYRCPDCISIHTCRPKSHPKFIQASRFSVFISLLLKITFSCWHTGICSSRQRQWFRTFKYRICRQANIDFGNIVAMLEALFTEFFDENLAVLFSSDYFLSLLPLIVLHLSFLVTDYGPSP